MTTYRHADAQANRQHNDHWIGHYECGACGAMVPQITIIDDDGDRLYLCPDCVDHRAAETEEED